MNGIVRVPAISDGNRTSSGAEPSCSASQESANEKGGVISALLATSEITSKKLRPSVR